MSLPAPVLPLPQLTGVVASNGVHFLTDERLFEACGTRIAFTGRRGGVSKPPYEGLDLGTHVGDDPADVAVNRRLALEACGLSAFANELIIPNQVHSSTVLFAGEGILPLSQAAAPDCDGVICSSPGVPVLLCFADCVPVIIVAPDGCFAVVHSGRLGAAQRIAGGALEALAGARGLSPASCNVYIGPHICGNCYETGERIVQSFVQLMGPDCAVGTANLSLEAAVRHALLDAGACSERIHSCGTCTLESTDDYYSYRAEDKICGRHGAISCMLP
ncbi:MAG: laccase domain-containing protein [Coriobacteriales bacterium]|nr:laccase domain-containing protein [Coriobacteriales bacterium]